MSSSQSSKSGKGTKGGKGSKGKFLSWESAFECDSFSSALTFPAGILFFSGGGLAKSGADHPETEVEAEAQKGPNPYATPKRESPKKNADTSSERKRYKIDFGVTTPKRNAMQLRGMPLKGGLLSFFFRSSEASGENSQPFVLNLFKRLERDPELMKDELGIALIGSRVDDNGDHLPASDEYPESVWHLCITREEDVGSMESWLNTVKARLNKNDIANDKTIFKYSPLFDIGSYGTKAKPKLLEEVISRDQLVEFVRALHNLDLPHNRADNFETVPFHLYFKDPKAAKSAVKDYYEDSSF